MISAELVRKARAQMKRAADYQFFFDHLQSPDWIPALIEEGFLKDPPPAEIDAGYIRYSPWPESSYLARVAHAAPELVARAIEGIPQTDNAFVKRDLAQAAANMPPSISATLATRVLGWIDPNSRRLLIEPVLELAWKLLEFGAVEEAVDMALRLGDIPKDAESARNWTDGTNAHVRGLLGDTISQFFAGLTGDAASFALRQVGNGLNLILESENGEPQAIPAPDGSTVWRPAIEAHEQNKGFDERSLVVDIVRDLAEKVAAGTEGVEHVISMMEEWRWAVFIRVALHIARLHADEIVGRTQQLILSAELFESIDVRHEYYWLVHDVLSAPKPSFPVTRYVDLIDSGPPDWLVERSRARPDQEGSIRRWFIERLHPVKEVLPEVWSTQYEEWVEELGEPSHPDFPFFMAGGFEARRQSPLSSGDLASMAVDEIAQFITRWEPSDGFAEPGADDLGRAIGGVVARSPARFAASAQYFELGEPTYVRHLLDGFRIAIQNESSFDWQPILQLGRWVLEQSDEPFDRDDWHQDPDWSWARKSLVDLVRDGLESRTASIPVEQSDLVWHLISRLAEDPDPSAEHEEQYGGSNMDPITMSLNTIRGSAFHALIGYVDWLNRDTDSDGKRLTDEVKELLDRHLELEFEPSLAVRSVFGWGLGTLLDSEEGWARDRVDTIFPGELERDAYREAAWLGFLSHWRPSRRLFEVLGRPYQMAVDRLPSTLETRVIQMDEALGSHLLSYYWLGILDLGENGLLGKFYDRANDDLRGYMTRTMGRTLSDNKSLAPEVVEKTVELWTLRVRAGGAEDGRKHQSEFGSFVWWFRSGLDPEWLMDQFLMIAEVVFEIDNAFVVIERLPEFVESNPVSAMRTLRALIERDQWGHVVLGHRSEVRAILESALSSEGEPAARARDLIHWLAARGSEEYGDLL